MFNPDLRYRTEHFDELNKNKMFKYVNEHMTCNRTKKVFQTLDHFMWNVGFDVRLLFCHI